jgi:tryptophanyl-tRNA synthetase
MRFNRTYGEVFTVPELTVPPVGARIMDLADPTRKMSKSDPLGTGVIYLLDPPDVVARKVARAVTDSETGPGAVRYDASSKPGVSNLLDILATCAGCSIEDAVDQAPSYGALKKQVTEAVLGVLEPVQRRYAELAADPEYVDAVYADGEKRCRTETEPVLTAARKAMGLG